MDNFIDDVVGRIDLLLCERNMTRNALIKELDISVSTFSDWTRRKNSKHAIEIFMAISEFFNVSLDWLVYGEEKAKPDLSMISPEDRTLLSNYHLLPEYLKHDLNIYINGMVSAAKASKNNLGGGENED